MTVTTVMRGVRDQLPKKTDKKIQRDRDAKKRYLRLSRARDEKGMRCKFC
jgi:hypothetical protein